LSVSAATVAVLLATTTASPASEPDDVPVIGVPVVAASQSVIVPEKADFVGVNTVETLVPRLGGIVLAYASDAPGDDVEAGVEDRAEAPGEDKRERGKRKDILVEGQAGPTPGDPFEDINLQTFEVVQALDMALVEPLAHGYLANVPKPVRDGIHNAVTNLDEPIAFLSFLLQLKPVQALKTLGRFVVNSTIGLGGLIDVAKRKPFNRPHIENGFAHTLAYYGVGTGPYLYLPLIGSTYLRDFLAGMAQIPVLPTTVGKPFNKLYYVIPKVTLTALDERAQDDERIQEFRGLTSNPYAAFRSYYGRKRQAEVDFLKGLREDAEVPLFDDVPDDTEAASEPAADQALPQPDESRPESAPQMLVDDGVMLAE
jgi:phospholipid-binding lipoprotein MlaA